MGESVVIPYSILCCATAESVTLQVTVLGTICMSYSFRNLPLVGLLPFGVG